MDTETSLRFRSFTVEPQLVLTEQAANPFVFLHLVENLLLYKFKTFLIRVDLSSKCLVIERKPWREAGKYLENSKECLYELVAFKKYHISRLYSIASTICLHIKINWLIQAGRYVCLSWTSAFKSKKKQTSSTNVKKKQQDLETIWECIRNK